MSILVFGSNSNMFGQTQITNTYYTVRAFQTTGDPLSSLFFRLVHQAVKMQGIDISKYLENVFCRELARADYGQTVDLRFLYLKSGPPLTQIRQLVSELPQQLAQYLFFAKFTCEQCKQAQYCMTFEESLVRCYACHMPMLCTEAARLAFGAPEARLRCDRDGGIFYLCGMYTGGQQENYSVLVDYEEMKNNSDKVYVLESMPASTLQQTSRAPGYLAYLKKGKLDQYVKTHNDQVYRIIGRKLMFCWHNYRYLPDYALYFYERDESLPLYHDSSPVSTFLQYPIAVARPPERQYTYYPISTPKVVSYDWLVYLFLGLTILALFIAMIIQSVLIGRTRTTLRAGSIEASGVSFLAVDQVKSASQMQDYVNSVQGGPVVAKYAVASRHTVYFGPSLYFDRFKADNQSFATVQVEDACATGLAGIAPSIVNIGSLTVQSVTGAGVEAAQARVVRKLSSANGTNYVLNIQYCYFANLTTKAAIALDSLNASVIYAPVFAASKNLTTKMLNSTAAVTAQQCDVGLNAIVSSKLTTQQFAPLSQLQLTDLRPSNTTNTTFEASAASLAFQGSNVHFAPSAAANGSNLPFSVTTPTLNVVSGFGVTIYEVNAQNLHFRDRATVADIQAKNVRFLGGFAVSSSLNVTSLTVNYNCDAQTITSSNNCTGANVTATNVLGSTVKFGASYFDSTLPLSVGAYQIGRNGFKLANGSELTESDELMVEGAGNISFGSDLKLNKMLQVQYLTGASCNTSTFNGTQITGVGLVAAQITTGNMQVAYAVNVSNITASELALVKQNGYLYKLLIQEGNIRKLLATYCEIKQVTGEIYIRPDKCAIE